MTTFSDVDVRFVLWRLRPLARYHWLGAADKGYTTLADCVREWQDAQSIPTEAELVAEWDAYQVEEAAAAAAALERETDVRALRLADVALAQIASDRTTLAADLAALAGATTAERWNIVGRVMAALNRSLNREETELKVLARLARRYLNEE